MFVAAGFLTETLSNSPRTASERFAQPGCPLLFGVVLQPSSQISSRFSLPCHHGVSGSLDHFGSLSIL